MLLRGVLLAGMMAFLCNGMVGVFACEESTSWVPPISNDRTSAIEDTGTQASSHQIHGPMVSAVTDNSAKIWFRVYPQATVQVKYATDTGFSNAVIAPPIVVTAAENDYTGTITLQNLDEDTTYYYKIQVNGIDQTLTPQPRFKTFPTDACSVKIGILTDITTSSNKPAKPIETLSTENPDFVIVLGDFDHRNPPDLAEMRAMHREVRGDEKVSGATFRDHILYEYPVAHVWDDHDYGANNSDKTFNKRAEAIQAYDEYWPSYARPNPQAGIWHKFSYGTFVEVFMLDLRSQRDVDTYNDPRFTGDNRDELRNDPCRSMLDGDECPEGLPKGQKQWLKDGLRNSLATYKIIASSVTWNKTTGKDDAWWDFLAEQEELLNFIEDNNITGVIVVSGDIHSGGAIDDGTNAGVPEMSVPSINLGRKTTCRVHKLKPQIGCGQWSHGFRSRGVGYGLITISPESAVIETKGRRGGTRFKLKLHIPCP